MFVIATINKIWVKVSNENICNKFVCKLRKFKVIFFNCLQIVQGSSGGGSNKPH